MERMQQPTSFRELLVVLAGGRGKRQKLVKELGRDYWEVTYWARKNDIPGDYWDDVIELAATKNMHWVTRDYLKGLRVEKADGA